MALGQKHFSNLKFMIYIYKIYILEHKFFGSWKENEVAGFNLF